MSHTFRCDSCDVSFKTKKELSCHIEELHDKRGTKRNRQDTSLLLDPARPCSMCEDSSLKIRRSEEEHRLTQAAYEDVKQILEVKIKEVTEMNLELKVAKEDIVKLKALTGKPTSPDDLKVIEEENSLMKHMVKEKDDLIRKMKETHNKEINKLELEKAAAEEAFGNAKRENTKMLDKETILLDIFKNMRTFIDKYHKNDVEIPS